MSAPVTTYLNKGNITYDEALWFQQSLRDGILQKKQNEIATRDDNVLILCEHPPVLTFGSSAKAHELFIPREQLQCLGIDIRDIRRGGAITFHGPGQIVGYPVLDLEQFKTDVRWYIQSLSEVIIRTLSDYQITGYYDPEYPGVWILDQNTRQKKKICAIGVHLSRWVSNHGFAFNVCNSMDYYRYFVPCGITQTNRVITTLQNELNYPVDMEEVKERILRHFRDVLETTLLVKEPQPSKVYFYENF